MTEKAFDTRIKREQRRLMKLYKNLTKDRLEMTRTLIERAAYMVVSLEDMEAKVAEDGLVIEMKQGDYSIERAHPLLQQYNAMVKNYNSTIKQLNELLPSVEAEQAGQALMRFATKPTATTKARK